MIRLLLANLAHRLRDWWFRPQPGDVPRWTLRKILELADDTRDHSLWTLPKSEQDLYTKQRYEARRPLL